MSKKHVETANFLKSNVQKLQCNFIRLFAINQVVGHLM